MNDGAPDDRASRNARLGVLAIAAGIGCGVGASSLWAAAGDDPNLPLLAGLATQGFWIGLAVGGATLVGHAPLGDRLGLGPIRMPVALLLLLGLGVFASSNGLSVLLSLAELRDTGTLAEIDAIASRAAGPSFALALLALAIAPGIAEELLFRGLLQGFLVERWGAPLGIAAAAAGFGLAHFDPVHSSVAFVLGGYLGIVAYLARSVRASMLWHVANNALALIAPRIGAGWGIDPLVASAGLLGLAGAIALGVSLRMHRNRGVSPST